MTPVRLIELWRYPVKGMRGECVQALTAGPRGIAGDRAFAFRSTAAPAGKPMLGSRERTRLLLYSAATHADGTVWVSCPDGPSLPVRSAALLEHLQRHVAEPGARWELVESTTPQTDVRPVALITAAALRELAEERGEAVDARRFRANLVLSGAPALQPGTPLHIGGGAIFELLERIPRCRIVSLDPQTAEADRTLLPHLAARHSGRFGTYVRVAQTGELHTGDDVW